MSVIRERQQLRDMACIPLNLLRQVTTRHPGAWTHVNKMRDLRGVGTIKHWPDWCFCPRTFFLQTAMSDFPPERIKAALAKMPPEKKSERLALADVMTALAAWRMGMSIYRFDPTLAQSLVATPVDKLPVKAFYHLPEWCVYIEAPPGLSPDIIGFFAHLEYVYYKESASLHLIYIKRGEPGTPLYTDTMALPLDYTTIEESVLAAQTRSAEYSALHGLTMTYPHDQARKIAQGESRYALPACLNLILYLCADEADFGDRARPRNPEPTKTKKGMKLFPASAPRYWSVGQTLGEKLREAVRLRNEDAGERSGPSPHLRRAHWHSYWVGKGRKDIRVRWLHPILVGINAGAIAPDTAPDEVRH